ncbi:MAG: lipid A biosynthesis lauroyl acyltransferase, partial [Pseudomonadales bacterium]|nr:lipid A biosynthesis lauroyl acyltransferase [Pseudomonadales bacterium]
MPFRLLSPAHWPTWLLIAVAFFVVRLPIRYQLQLGRLIGNLLQRIGGRRARIADQNIELCFPD